MSIVPARRFLLAGATETFFLTINEIALSAGTLPKQNSSMTIPPLMGFLVVAAARRNVYSQPHGNSPVKSPIENPDDNPNRR